MAHNIDEAELAPWSGTRPTGVYSPSHISVGDVELVRELLAAAKHNGYPMETCTAVEIAHDMNRFASEVETWSHDYLVQVIREATVACE